jgi:hypothetical protein
MDTEENLLRLGMLIESLLGKLLCCGQRSQLLGKLKKFGRVINFKIKLGMGDDSVEER